MMDLKIADDNGRLPTVDRAVRKPKVIVVEKQEAWTPQPLLPEAKAPAPEEKWKPVRMDGTKGVNVWLTALIVMASILILLFLVCYIMKKRLSCRDIWKSLTQPCRKNALPNTSNGRKGSLRRDSDKKKAKPNSVGPPADLGT